METHNQTIPSDIKAIVDTFPYPSVPSIQGLPIYSTIKELHLKLNANAASVQSDGNNGLIYLTVTDEIYNTLLDVPFIESTNPGIVPTFPQHASTCLQMEIRQDFDENRRVFNQVNNTDKTLKQLLISAVDNMFIKVLKNPISGYSNVTTKQVLNHLNDCYGQLTPHDLKINDNEMNQPYNTTPLIEYLYKQIGQARDVAISTNAPYNEAQILNVAYNLVFNTHVFLEICREWRRLPLARKTCERFKTIFTEAHKDYMMLQNEGQHRFHTANATESEDHTHTTAEALANLVSAIVVDRSAIAISHCNQQKTNGTYRENCQNNWPQQCKKSLPLNKQLPNKYAYQLQMYLIKTR